MKGPVVTRFALLATFAWASVAAHAAERPNVVLIMADDLGADAIGCYGGLTAPTPHIDALAASGVRFTQAHAQPLCTPTRVQIMTGQYNFRNYREFGYLSPDETTFGDLLRAGRYRTSVAGKWQLAGQGRKYPEKTDPADWGFDEHCLWQLNNRKPYGDRGSRYWDPYLERNGEVVTPGKEVYGPDVVNEFVLDFVERNRDRPFFAYYPMILTHGPFTPTPASADRRSRDDQRNFAEMVAYADVLVGRVVAKLDELGLRERTLVIFTGDNGTAKGIAMPTARGDVAGAKGMLTDAGTHVPFVASWPGSVSAGAVSDRLIDFTDVIPTLLAVTGTEAPAGFSSDGVPFLSADGSIPAQERQAIYSWYDPRQDEGGGKNAGVFARDRRYKLHADGRFFDVTATPLERAEDALSGDLPPEAVAAKGRLQSVIDRYAAEGGVIRPAGEAVGEPGGRQTRRERRAGAAAGTQNETPKDASE